MQIIVDRITLSKLMTIPVLVVFVAMAYFWPDDLYAFPERKQRFWVGQVVLLFVIWRDDLFNSGRAAVRASEEAIPIQRWIPHVFAWFCQSFIIAALIYRFVT